MSNDPPEVRSLFAKIAKCLPLAVGLDAPVFRSTGVLYANEADFSSGAGAEYHGGRWNPPRIRAVYGSLDPITAAKESYQQFLKYGFTGVDIKPRVIAGMRVKVCRLLDLTDAGIRRRVGFSLASLLEEDWQAIQESGEESWTQAIGKGCYVSGFEGMLVPSAHSRSGKNVVLFIENLDSTSQVGVMARNELPPHPTEW